MGASPLQRLIRAARHSEDLVGIRRADRHPRREPQGVQYCPMLILEHRSKVIDGETTYVARVCGDERTDGTWEGWLEFQPTDGAKPALLTDRETSQPNRAAIEYWAAGLEPLYLEGALARAQGRLL